MNELRTHIVVDPEVRFGKPCIKGTRITVGDILQWLSGGMTEQGITGYPRKGCAFFCSGKRRSNQSDCA